MNWKALIALSKFWVPLLAALTVKDDPLLLVVSLDHIIKDESAFIEAVNKAIPLAEDGSLVTFGIIPTELILAMVILKAVIKMELPLTWRSLLRNRRGS
jgi:hypothetical protein